MEPHQAGREWIVTLAASRRKASLLRTINRLALLSTCSCCPIYPVPSLFCVPSLQVKNGTLREYGWGDMIFNYGCVPQTWEDPNFIHHDTGVG